MEMALTLFVLVAIGLMIGAVGAAFALAPMSELEPAHRPVLPPCPFCRCRDATVEAHDCPADDTVQCRCCHTCVAANCRGDASTNHQETPPCQPDP